MSDNVLIFFRENKDLLLAIVGLLTLIVGQKAHKGYKRRQREKALECQFPMMEKTKEGATDGKSMGFQRPGETPPNGG